jgi:hypothetical protein
MIIFKIYTNIPQERGIKRIIPYIIFIFTHLVILGERKKWLHELLGEEAMWLLISKKIYKPLL